MFARNLPQKNKSSRYTRGPKRDYSLFIMTLIPLLLIFSISVFVMSIYFKKQISLIPLEQEEAKIHKGTIVNIYESIRSLVEKCLTSTWPWKFILLILFLLAIIYCLYFIYTLHELLGYYIFILIFAIALFFFFLFRG